jgi:hypothetical protein
MSTKISGSLVAYRSGEKFRKYLDPSEGFLFLESGFLLKVYKSRLGTCAATRSVVGPLPGPWSDFNR